MIATTSATSYGDTVASGTARADTLDGRGGNDRIHGHAGNDTLIGGNGNNVVEPEKETTDPRSRRHPRPRHLRPGIDTVTADRIDLLTGCERVTLP